MVLAILSTVVAAVVLVSAMLAEPKVIARVLVLVELNIPVERVNPLSARVPWVRVVVPLAVKAAPRVTVMPEPLTPKA